MVGRPISYPIGVASPGSANYIHFVVTAGAVGASEGQGDSPQSWAPVQADGAERRRLQPDGGQRGQRGRPPC